MVIPAISFILATQRNATFSRGSLPLSLFSNNSSIRTQLPPLMRYFPFRKCAASADAVRDAYIAKGEILPSLIRHPVSKLSLRALNKAIRNDTFHKRSIQNKFFSIIRQRRFDACEKSAFQQFR